MAGRGRSATLPSWLTQSENGGAENTSPRSVSSEYNAQPGATVTELSGSNRRAYPDDDRKVSDSRSRERPRGDSRDRDRDRGRDRERDRDRSRDRKRERSRSRDRGSSRRSPGRHDKAKRDASSSPDEPVRSWKPRKQRSSNFDIKPEGGVELPGVGAAISAHASLAGGAQAAAILQRYGQAPGPGMSQATGLLNENSVNQQQTKHARRLYVGGIPADTREDDLGAYFSDIIKRAVDPPLQDDSSPIIQVYINHDKCFAFVELKSIELTTACLGFDGIKYNHRSGSSVLRVRRPNDFKPELVPNTLRPIPSINLQALGIVGTTVSDGPEKVFIGGLPYNLTDENVKELLSAFGPLKSFHLVRDPGMPTSKGYGFCEYYDSKITKTAIEGLNGMSIGEKTLTVRIATQNASNSAQGGQMAMMNPLLTMGLSMDPSQLAQLGRVQGLGAAPMGGLGLFGLPPAGTGAGLGLAGMGLAAAPMGGMIGGGAPRSRVLRLGNMVTKDEVDNDEECEEIRQDVKEECSSHGEVLSVVIPREKDGFAQAGAGNIYVEFRDAQMAERAALALYGRKFAEKVVIVEYFDETRFANRAIF